MVSDLSRDLVPEDGTLELSWQTWKPITRYPSNRKPQRKSTLELIGTNQEVWYNTLHSTENLLWFQGEEKRMKKNKHNVKLKPHWEQKIWTKRPQSSIFMGNFQFYQDRVRKGARIAMLYDLNAELAFCFYINIWTSHISFLFMFT